MTKKFWIVVSEARGPASWPCKHLTESLAFHEAERLARNNGGKFFVMEAKGAAAKVEIQTARFDDNDDIPF